MDTRKNPIQSSTREYYSTGASNQCKPNLSRVLVFGSAVWVKVKDAGKLEPQAVEGRFIGYDEESKGYRIYYPKRCTVIVDHDVYFDKDAAVELDEVVFEGEPEIILNPPLENNTTSAVNPPDIKPNDSPAPISAPRARRNSLQGLPQFDPEQYGRGNRRCTARNEEQTLVADGGLESDDESDKRWEEPSGDQPEAKCFREAMHMAMLAIVEDEPSFIDAMRGSGHMTGNVLSTRS